MCVIVSNSVHKSKEKMLQVEDLQPTSNVAVPFVQEAIFYSSKESLIEIVVTVVVKNNSGGPIDMWVIHESDVDIDDLTDTLLEPATNAHTAALAQLLSDFPRTEEKGLRIGFEEFLKCESVPAKGERRICPLSENRNGSDRNITRPFACIGFGALEDLGANCAHLARCKISIGGETFHRLVPKVRLNAGWKFFYGINGPRVVLNDIRSALLASTPNEYIGCFDSLVEKCRVTIEKYEVVTFDPEISGTITYDRAISETRRLLKGYALRTEELGTMTTNVWMSESERFIILRASLAH